MCGLPCKYRIYTLKSVSAWVALNICTAEYLAVSAFSSGSKVHDPFLPRCASLPQTISPCRNTPDPSSAYHK